MENPYWHPEVKHHVINTDDVRLLAFDIFNTVRCSMSLQGSGLEEEYVSGDQPSSIEQVHYFYAELYLSKRLLELAMLTRTLDDYWLDYGHEDYIEAIERINKEGDFGTQDIGGKCSNLSIRDALNRIIHAQDVRPVYETEDDSDDPKARWGMDGQIELRGEHNRKPWTATLNILEFLDGVIEVLDLTDELGH